ncbi:MAG: thermonuclease family protein [Porticoccaceae bacterium]|nr:thermonuclease family protein [Porticoccaceae bacterium]
MFFCVLLWVFSCSAIALAAPPRSAGETAANCAMPGGLSAGLRPVGIERVQDGDSFIAADGRRVRLIGVNTPELGSQGRAGEPMSRQAKAFVDDFVRANPRLVLVPGSEPRDNHGRYLMHAYTPEGQSLEALLVAEGLGWAIAVPPNLILADCLAGLEQQARRAGRGLWRDNVTVPSSQIVAGGFQRVVGKVEKVVFAKAWWINLEGGLAGVIYAEHQKNFSRSQLRELEGRRVVLRGWVYPSNSRSDKPWRVKVETIHAIEGL